MKNAVEYTAEGGKVTVQFKQMGEKIRFEVTDTGIGIPAVEQPKIFNRFYRATNASTAKTDSSGLGLSIAKWYVEQHGGSIWFTSREGKGSTFWFEIPVANE